MQYADIKAGDRVTVTPCPGYPKDGFTDTDKATVVFIRQDQTGPFRQGSRNVLVEFDNWFGGHDADYSTGEFKYLKPSRRNRWWVSHDALTCINDEDNKLTIGSLRNCLRESQDVINKLSDGLKERDEIISRKQAIIDNLEQHTSRLDLKLKSLEDDLEFSKLEVENLKKENDRVRRRNNEYRRAYEDLLACVGDHFKSSKVIRDENDAVLEVIKDESQESD